MSADEAFAKASDYDSLHFTMTTDCCARDFGHLYSGHAYTLLGTAAITKKDGSKVRLMKIRNPHGSERYTGPWCDTCEEWTDDYKK